MAFLSIAASLRAHIAQAYASLVAPCYEQKYLFYPIIFWELLILQKRKKSGLLMILGGFSFLPNSERMGIVFFYLLAFWKWASK